MNSAPPALDDVQAPSGFGPYDVLGVVGRGGMGIVYKGRNRDTGELVAIKTVPVPKHRRLQSIRAEIAALSRLSHAGIVRTLENGVERGTPWYAMELLEGQTFDRYLNGVWPERHVTSQTISTQAPSTMSAGGLGGLVTVGWELSAAAGANENAVPHPVAGVGRLAGVLALVRGLCEPLAYIHGRGIVHRDLKPSNVFVRRDGAPVLMDFGLLTRARGTVGREALELGGVLVGTVAYLSPEQIRREALDARTNLYAIGCILYEAVTGLIPFRGRTDDDLLRQHLAELPVPPSRLVDGLDPRLEQLILRLLEKRRRDRIGYADDVARVLDEVMNVDPAPSPASGSSYRNQVYLYRPELAGRDEVMEPLSAALEGLKHRRGGLILLSGESGIGKTFVAAEVAKRAAMRGLRVLGGECVPTGSSSAASTTYIDARGAPLHPWRALFQSIADRCYEIGASFTDKVVGHRAKILTSQIAAFASLPGQTHPDPPELPSEEAHRRLITAALEVVGNFAADGAGLLVVLDDLQWADELSLKLLGAMTPAWLAEHGIVVLGTFRSEEVTPALGEVLERSGCTPIHLDRLEPQTVGQIAADMLATTSVPETVVKFLGRQTEGVPFFAAEYLRIAVTEGLLFREQGQWRFKGEGASEPDLAALPLPRSIRDLMLQRFSGLGENLRALLDGASVVGRDVDAEFLAAILDVPEEVVSDGLRELIPRQILEPRDFGRFRFVHDKLRETVLRAMAPDRVATLHRAAVHAIEERADEGRLPYAELAHHAVQGKLWDKAIDYLEKAGDQALANFAHREAIVFFTAAAELAPRAAVAINRLRRARWERCLMGAHLNLGKMTQAEERAKNALAHCGFRTPSSWLGWRVGLAWQILARMAQSALAPLLRVRSSEQRFAFSEAAYVLNRLVEPSFLSHRVVQGMYFGFRDLNLAARVRPCEALARGYATMSMVVGLGPLVALGRRWAEQAIRLAREGGFDNAVPYCLSRAAIVLMDIPDWKPAAAYLDEAERLSRERSDLRQLAEVMTVRALLDHFKGDFAGALAAAEETVAIGETMDDEQLKHWGSNLTLGALARLGRGRETAGHVHNVNEHLRNDAVREGESIFAEGNLSLVHWTLGDLDLARTHAERSLQGLRKEAFLAHFHKGGLESICETFLGLLERANPRTDEWRELAARAGECLGRMQKFATLFGVAKPRALLLTGQWWWIKGKHQRAHRCWQEAEALGRRLHMPYEVGRARLELGRHLNPGELFEGRTGAAYLDDAAQLFETLGAQYDRRRARYQ